MRWLLDDLDVSSEVFMAGVLTGTIIASVMWVFLCWLFTLPVGS
jgi:hypothetical protein